MTGPTSWQQLQAFWAADAQASGKPKWNPVYRITDPLYYLHRLLRLTEYVVNQPETYWKPYRYALLYRLLRVTTRLGISLPLNQIGPGLSIAHYGSVVIGNVQIGSNFRVHSAVNIGEGGGQNPTIGNDVYVGPGAKIFGGITIGDGASIGANAVVLSDVAPGTTVAGIPAKPISDHVMGTDR